MKRNPRLSSFTVFISLLLSSACASRPQTTIEGANLVRVLNSVRCHHSKTCDDTDINRLWRACIDDGFIEDVPPGKYMESRSISQLIRSRVTESQVLPRKRTITDANGIVSVVEDGQELTDVTKEAYGYCVGDEYILK
jgi:hypothetical protein